MDSDLNKILADSRLNVSEAIEDLCRQYLPFAQSDALPGFEWHVPNEKELLRGGLRDIKLLLRDVESSFANEDWEGLYKAADSLIESLEETGKPVFPELEEIIRLAPILDIEEASLIYQPKNADLIIPELIVPVSERLLGYVAKNPQYLYKLTAREFEELIAEIFHIRGFAVELTKQTRDGGKDIIAFHELMNIKTKYIIECKRYASHNPVDVSLVRQLYGVKMAEAANIAILATTSFFTKPAIEFQQHHMWDLSLKDFNDVVTWVSNCS